MRLDEMAAQIAHVAMIVDDHVAAHGVLREPGCDLLAPVGAGRAGRGLVQNAPVNPAVSRTSCSSATVLPCRQVDETTTSAKPRATISFNT